MDTQQFAVFARKTKGLFRRLPYLQEAIWDTKRATTDHFKPYNGRWEMLRGWLDDLDKLSAKLPRPDRRILVVASTGMYVDCLLATSVVLAARGCEIDFFWIPYLHGIPFPEQERFQKWSDRFVPPTHSRIRLIRISDIRPADSTPELEAMAKDSADFDSCYFLAKEFCDYENCPEDLNFYKFRYDRNLDALRRITTLLNFSNYDGALTGNGRLVEMGAFYLLARAKGIQCASIDTFGFGSQICASVNEPACVWNTDEIWKRDEPHVLDAVRRKKILEEIAVREDPQRDKTFNLQAASPQTREYLAKSLSLDLQKPIALACANLAWDSAVLRRNRCFDSMKSWYLKTIAWFAERPQWQLIVRTHPVEAMVEQPKSVSDFIDEAFPKLPANVRLVRPTDKTNTYSLMRIAKLGICYTSTVGLEMVMRGLTAIVAGEVHYLRKGFTLEPQIERDYFYLLTQAIENRLPPLSERQIELAMSYSDCYFRDFPRHFPWKIWETGKSVGNDWPMQRILDQECPTEFLDTFDFLAGRQSATTESTSP